jgi:hypothetical protein
MAGATQIEAVGLKKNPPGETLTDVLEIFRKRMLLDLETVMPAIVIEYDRNKHVALVQPLIKRVDVMGNSIDLPQISVTVNRMYSGDFLIDVPLHPNDTGWVVASSRDSNFIKGKNPNELGKFEGTDVPNTSALHKYLYGYFIPDRWGDAYMPNMEEDKSHVTDFDDPTNVKPPEPETQSAIEEYVAKIAKQEVSYYGDIEKSPTQFFTKYKTVGMLADRAKDDLAEIPQPDGKGGLIDPPIGGKEAREFNTDYDRLVIQSKDKKQRITMGQKDIKVYSSNLIYVNSQKDIIAYARENVDVHVGEKIQGADTSEGKVNIYANNNVKVTCSSLKKDGVIDVCADNKMMVHSPEVVIDGNGPDAKDPQQGDRLDPESKAESFATNIKVHANDVKIACTMKPNAVATATANAPTGKVTVSSDTQIDVHSPIINIDGGKPNGGKPVSGEPTKTPGVVNILGNVNITGAVSVTGAGTVTATTEVTAGSIALTKHKHTGCQGGSTGAPIP